MLVCSHIYDIMHAALKTNLSQILIQKTSYKLPSCREKKAFFIKAYKKAIAATDYFFQEICKYHDLSTPEGKNKIIQTAQSYFEKIPIGLQWIVGIQSSPRPHGV